MSEVLSFGLEGFRLNFCQKSPRPPRLLLGDVAEVLGDESPVSGPNQLSRLEEYSSLGLSDLP